MMDKKISTTALAKEKGLTKPEVDSDTLRALGNRMIGGISNALKERGLISENTPRGIWKLTEAGIEHAKRQQ